MNDREFLAHVLPDTGPYCIARGRWVTDNKGKVGLAFSHIAVDTLDDALIVAHSIDKKQREAYFALGTLISTERVKMPSGNMGVSRVATNIRGLKAYSLDLDVKPGKYETQKEAVRALDKFCTSLSFPTPTVVSSGGGIHVHFALTEEVPRDVWKQQAEILKQLTIDHGLHNDAGVVANPTHVLRVVGTNNWKTGTARPVKVLYAGQPVPPDAFHSRLSLRFVGPQPTFGASNTNRYTTPPPPLDGAKLREKCQLIREVTDPANQATMPEQMWYAAMTFAAQMEPADGDAWALEISRYDAARFTPEVVQEKLVDVRALPQKGVSATTCERLGKDYQLHCGKDICSSCPLKGKITSPAAVAHKVILAAPIAALMQGQPVTIPDPPPPYVRTPEGIAIMLDDPLTQSPKPHIFCTYDMYPARRRSDNETGKAEPVVWKVNIPKEGWQDIIVPPMQKNQLLPYLASNNVLIDEPNISFQYGFMTAYTRQLQSMTRAERAFAKLGFNANNEFVLGSTLYKPDGTSEEHAMNELLHQATMGGICTGGDFDEWRRFISMYALHGLEPYRCYIYSSFASILYHMTEYGATAVCAVGVSGRGKTTLIEACASIWGNPKLLKGYGSGSAATVAAAEARFSAMNHLPVFIDEITEKDPKDVAQLIFGYSQGIGKMRSQLKGGIRPDTARWSNMLLLTGNQDEYERMAGVRRESRQHAMRLVQIEFDEQCGTIISKDQGYKLKCGVLANYGWAGHRFVRYVTMNYAKVKKRIEQVMKETDARINSPSEERFWTAWKACCQVAAEICAMLDLLPGYPVSHDVDWMEKTLLHLRAVAVSNTTAPAEVMSEFLDEYLPNTLIVGSASGNIDNVIREPRGELYVRREVDGHQYIISCTAFRKYCLDNKINMGPVLETLTKNKTLIDTKLRTLGADTPFRAGRVWCMVIDANKLVGAPALAAANPSPLPAAVPAQQQPGTALQRAAVNWAKGNKV